jgi:hypothetical protein
MKTSSLYLLTLFIVAGPLSATELHNLDFTPPEVGIYETVFGSPSVQSSVGPFTDALVFHAVTFYDQIRLPINLSAPRYNIQYDVFTHNLLNSQYAFTMLLDTPEVRNVGFHGVLNDIYAYQPFVGVVNLGPFANDQVYHLEISIDLAANLWSVAVDGTQKFSHTIDASGLESIRFSMAPWTVGASNAPGTYAALDNVTVNAIPEPSSAALVVTGLVFCIGAVYSRFKSGARRNSSAWG